MAALSELISIPLIPDSTCHTFILKSVNWSGNPFETSLDKKSADIPTFTPTLFSTADT